MSSQKGKTFFELNRELYNHVSNYDRFINYDFGPVFKEDYKYGIAVSSFLFNKTYDIPTQTAWVIIFALRRYLTRIAPETSKNTKQLYELTQDTVYGWLNHHFRHKRGIMSWPVHLPSYYKRQVKFMFDFYNQTLIGDKE